MTNDPAFALGYLYGLVLPGIPPPADLSEAVEQLWNVIRTRDVDQQNAEADRADLIAAIEAWTANDTPETRAALRAWVDE